MSKNNKPKIKSKKPYDGEYFGNVKFISIPLKKKIDFCLFDEIEKDGKKKPSYSKVALAIKI